jgi:hypothetical protein
MPDPAYWLPPLHPLSLGIQQSAVALWFGATAAVSAGAYYSSRSIWFSLILSSLRVASFWTA